MVDQVRIFEQLLAQRYLLLQQVIGLRQSTRSFLFIKGYEVEITPNRRRLLGPNLSSSFDYIFGNSRFVVDPEGVNVGEDLEFLLGVYKQLAEKGKSVNFIIYKNEKNATAVNDSLIASLVSFEQGKEVRVEIKGVNPENFSKEVNDLSAENLAVHEHVTIVCFSWCKLVILSEIEKIISIVRRKDQQTALKAKGNKSKSPVKTKRAPNWLTYIDEETSFNCVLIDFWDNGCNLSLIKDF